MIRGVGLRFDYIMYWIVNLAVIRLPAGVIWGNYGLTYFVPIQALP